jgi:hypothetical protein
LFWNFIFSQKNFKLLHNLLLLFLKESFLGVGLPFLTSFSKALDCYFIPSPPSKAGFQISIIDGVVKEFLCFGGISNFVMTE